MAAWSLKQNTALQTPEIGRFHDDKFSPCPLPVKQTEHAFDYQHDLLQRAQPMVHLRLPFILIGSKCRCSHWHGAALTLPYEYGSRE